MKDRKQYEKWANAVWERYRLKLHLTRHTNVTFKLKEEIDYMECSFRYPYLDNEIRYTTKVVKDFKKDKKNAERALVHEFCHILTDPLYDKAFDRFTGKKELENERELLTDHLAGIFVELCKR